MYQSISADHGLVCSTLLHSPQSTHILSQGNFDPENTKESQGNSLKIVLAFFHPPFPLSLHLCLPPGSLALSNCEAERSETAMKAWLPYTQREEHASCAYTHAPAQALMHTEAHTKSLTDIRIHQLPQCEK